MNNNLQDDYCSFEVSQLLKEKGFEVPCNMAYSDKELLKSGRLPNYHNFNEDRIYKGVENSCSCPTHALAIKWIRENFDIHISVGIDRKVYMGGRHVTGYEVVISDIAKDSSKVHARLFHYDEHNFTFEEWIKKAIQSPEEATEAALLYTLKNLI